MTESGGLFRRTLGVLLGLIAAVSIAATALSAWNLNRTLSQEFRSKGIAIASGIADSSVEVILNRDASTVQATIDRFTEIGGVSYVYVVDSQNEIVSHTFVPAVPPEVRAVRDRQKETTVTRRDIAGRGSFTDVAAPILAGVAGYVHVGMDDGVINAEIRAAVLRQLLIVAAIFALAAMAAYWLARSVARPVNTAAEVMQRVAAGDLTADVQVQSRDETGRLLSAVQSMTSNLNSLVGQVQQSSMQVMSASAEIAATARQQAATANGLGASTNEVVAAARQISATSEGLVRTMGSVSQVVTETAGLAESGRRGLQGIDATMRGLREATTVVSNRLDAVSDQAAGIDSVIETITRVADQTNLLSLNAAIEAEKAGQAGLGFGVVATEIRRLADQTAVAALDIEKMVRAMRSAVAASVREMARFASDVRSGGEEIESVSSRLAEILERVVALTPHFEEVSDGMLSQSQGAHQISQSMLELSEAARQMIESLNEFNSATESLSGAARLLQREISHFKVSSPERNA